jgi:hypothetical protein
MVRQNSLYSTSKPSGQIRHGSLTHLGPEEKFQKASGKMESIMCWTNQMAGADKLISPQPTWPVAT